MARKLSSTKRARSPRKPNGANKAGRQHSRDEDDVLGLATDAGELDQDTLRAHMLSMGVDMDAVVNGEDDEEIESDEASEGRDEDEEDKDEDEDEDDGEDEHPFAPSDSELQPDDGEALDTLGAFVSRLDTSTKRKVGDDDGDGDGDGEGSPDGAAIESSLAPARKRRMLNERTEAGVEGEFGVRGASGSKLQLDDLLAPLASTSSSLNALRKSTKPLMKRDALPAPLPQRTHDRLAREAAYEQTKAEMDKWKATMKRIKEADHLSFPLQVPQKVNPSKAGLVSKFTPSNALESAVDKLLKAAHMREEGDIVKTEELKMNNLSVEEVAQRRAELRKMRELMFRAEAKAKRIAKIKSKTYRKIHRKTRERVKGLIKQADGTEEVDGAEEQMKREVERARERATLRHKNTGKWAKVKAMEERGEVDVDQRLEIETMLEQEEKLRAKIHGRDGDGDGDEDDEEDSGDDDGGIDTIKASAFEELQKVEQDDDVPRQTDKGVFAMKFMQGAMAREAQKASAAVDDFRDEMARLADGTDGEPDNEGAAPFPNGPHVQRVGGRVVFRPGRPGSQGLPLQITPSESSSTLKSSEPAMLSPAVASQVTIPSFPPAQPASPPAPQTRATPKKTGPNPWLVANATQSRRPRNDDLAEEGKKKNTGATVELESLVEPELPKGEEEPKTAQQRGKSKGEAKRVKAFEQRDLVALAFSGDNVVQDFEKLKQREIATDAPREEDHTLPGWGSWGGTGTKRNPHAKKFIKKIAGVDPTARADYGKPHVIISEKTNRRAAKYLVKDLPYPYTSRAQFERSIEVPVGAEWNTRVEFQRQTLPRVVKKMGTVIDPLEKIT